MKRSAFRKYEGARISTRVLQQSQSRATVNLNWDAAAFSASSLVCRGSRRSNGLYWIGWRTYRREVNGCDPPIVLFLMLIKMWIIGFTYSIIGFFFVFFYFFFSRKWFQPVLSRFFQALHLAQVQNSQTEFFQQLIVRTTKTFLPSAPRFIRKAY